MNSQLRQYQATQLSTSVPEKILLMLYDGAINFSKIALEKVDKGDTSGKGVYISKAQAIVSELMNSLNHEVGGEVSKRLEQLYIYLIDEYVAANTKNSQESLEHTIKILGMLRDTWQEAIDVMHRERAGEQPHQGMRSI
jgi:flagellar protein FliS